MVLIRGISTMVNGNLLNFGKRYEDNLRVKVALRFGCAKQLKKILKGV